MGKLIATAVVAVACVASAAVAADLGGRKPRAAPVVAPVSPWDLAFGAAVMTDYNFRGISQSNRKPAVNAYFEPRYNLAPNLQLYAGVGGYSIELPNNAAAEVDIYGGVRPTFGPLALDLGVLYYYYPGGRTFTSLGGPQTCTNLFFAPPPGAGCNAIKGNLSFIELYAKSTYTFSDTLSAGLAVYHDPDWLNSGASGTWLSGTAKLTAPASVLPSGVGAYVSGEVAHYWLGTTDAFYFNTPLPDYLHWNVGLGFTWKTFTLDLRYHDTDLSKAECNVLTGDHTATFNVANITPINPSGLGSRWCGAAFIAKLSADLTLSSLK
jgi:hypothetical protein